MAATNPTTQNTMLLLLNEIDTIFARFNKHCDVVGMIVYNPFGTPLRSNLTKSETLNYIRIGSDLVIKAERGMRDLDMKADPLQMIRVRTGTREIFIAPDQLFTLLVIQEVGRKDDPDVASQESTRVTCDCPDDTNIPCVCRLDSNDDVTRTSDVDEPKFMSSQMFSYEEENGSVGDSLTSTGTEVYEDDTSEE